MGRPKDSSSKVADWSSREGLDWTGRGRAAGVSNEGVADNQLRIGYRPAYQNNCFGMIAALVRHSWGSVGSIPSLHAGVLASVVCNLLAALDGDPAQRSLRSVVRVAEHARPARGANWLAARRPRRGRNAGLVMQPIVRLFEAAWCRSISQSITSASGRVRTVADWRHHFGGNEAETFLSRESIIWCA